MTIQGVKRDFFQANADKKMEHSSLPEKMNEIQLWSLIFSEFATLQCPFEKKMNPHVEVASQVTAEWSKKFKLPSYEKYKFTELMGGAYPNCSAEMLTIFTCLVTLIFCYDDIVEQELCHTFENLQTFNKKNLAVLRGEDFPDNNLLTQAFEDIRVQLNRIATPKWMRRFSNNIEDHFEAIMWESTKVGIPDLELYLEKRPYTSFVYPMFDLCELAEDVEILDEIFTSQYIRELRLLCNNGVWMPNDIISYPKEQGRGNNIIDIFEYKENYNLIDAIAKAKEFSIKEFEKIQFKISQRPSTYGINEIKYIEGFLNWISSNFYWSKETYRYKNTDIVD